jgi:hypothetical protein
MNGVHFYFMHQGQQVGPVPFEQVKHLVASGRLGPTALVWQVGPEEIGGLSVLRGHARNVRKAVEAWANKDAIVSDDSLPSSD